MKPIIILIGIFGGSSFDRYYEQQLDDHLNEMDSDDFCQDQDVECALCLEYFHPDDLYKHQSSLICIECYENLEE